MNNLRFLIIVLALFICSSGSILSLWHSHLAPESQLLKMPPEIIYTIVQHRIMSVVRHDQIFPLRQELHHFAQANHQLYRLLPLFDRLLDNRREYLNNQFEPYNPGHGVWYYS
jgi:hypothetical protein